MKISPKQYAQVLFEVVSQSEKDDLDSLIKNFSRILIEHNRVSYLDKIIYFFELIWNKNKKVLPVQITSARPFDKQIVDLLRDYLQKVVHEEIELSTKVDKKIKGGLILRYGGKSIDYSLQNRLRQLKSKLIH